MANYLKADPEYKEEENPLFYVCDPERTRTGATRRSINKPFCWAKRQHPTKDKPLVTPIYTVKRLNELVNQAVIIWPKVNISSGEDCVAV